MVPAETSPGTTALSRLVLWLLTAALALAAATALPDPLGGNHHHVWGLTGQPAAPRLDATTALGQAVTLDRPTAYLELLTATYRQKADEPLEVLILEGTTPPKGQAEVERRLICRREVPPRALLDNRTCRIRLAPAERFSAGSSFYVLVRAGGGGQTPLTLWTDNNPVWPGPKAELISSPADGPWTAVPAPGHLSLNLGDDRPPARLGAAWLDHPRRLTLLIAVCLALSGAGLVLFGLLFRPPPSVRTRLVRLGLVMAVVVGLATALPLPGGPAGRWHKDIANPGDPLLTLEAGAAVGQVIRLKAGRKVDFVALRPGPGAKLEALVLRDSSTPADGAEIAARTLIRRTIEHTPGARGQIRLTFVGPQPVGKTNRREMYLLVRPAPGGTRPASVRLARRAAGWQPELAVRLKAAESDIRPLSPAVPAGRLASAIGFQGRVSILSGWRERSALVWWTLCLISAFVLDAFRPRRPWSPRAPRRWTPLAEWHPADWTLTGLLLLFTAALVPAALQAAGSYPELMTFVSDEPWYMEPTRLLITTLDVPRVAELLFPNLAASVLTAPLWGPLEMMGRTLDYGWLAIASRLVQIGFGLAAAVWLYRLCRLAARPWLSLAATVLMLFSLEFVNWSLTIHPDIFQLATIIGAVFHLARAARDKDRTDFYLAAVLTGLATGSKLYGVFIVPAGLAVAFLWSDPGWRRLSRRSFWADAIGFCLVSGAVTWLMCPNYLLYPDFAFGEAAHFYTRGAQAGPAMIRQLMPMRLANIASWKLIGAAAVALWLVTAATWLWRTISALRHGRGEAGPEAAVQVTILAFLAYYLSLYSDLFNITDGQRYTMPFVCLMPVALAWAAQRLLDRGREAVVVCLALILALSLGLRVTGSPWTDYLPASLTKIRAIGNGRTETATFKVGPPQSLTGYLQGWYQREEEGRFVVRGWVAANIAPGSSILYEAYMNLIPDDHDSPDLKGFPMTRQYTVDPAWVKKHRPDYVMTKKAVRTEAVIKADPAYRLVAGLKGGSGAKPAFVLKREANR